LFCFEDRSKIKTASTKATAITTTTTAAAAAAASGARTSQRKQTSFRLNFCFF